MDYSNTGKKPTFFVFLRGFIIGIFALSIFYYILLFAVTGDPSHPFSQFTLFQPWMSLLIVGFGIQVGLYWMLKNGFHISVAEQKDAKMATGTSTAVSGMAMVACCAHHTVDLLPILGFSAAALFLSEYQEQLLIFGVIANIAGIGMMLWFITGKSKPKLIMNFVTAQLKRIL